ncbi:MAG: NUDIX hydrolase [Anaerolineales bacterium]|jgi:ADP-ribose pyrophosphatase YjhB (NUDIX family)
MKMEKISSQQPYVTSINGKRRFACSPVAVMAFIVNERQEILLMKHPDQQEGWQVVNGAMEAEETVLQAVLREMYEEAGTDLRVRPLGTVHISTFHYDENVRYMLSVGYLLAYEGGDIKPGDDMAGSEYRWWSLEDLASPEVKLLIPPGEKWLVERAVDLYRMWRQEDIANQPGFDLSVRGKTK